MFAPPRIAGYRILEEVASGASGKVYRAIQEELDRVVAIKVVFEGLHGAEETRARFLRESRVQASLHHPNLLALYQAGLVDGRPYLVTEFIEAGSLRDLLRGTPRLPVARALEIGAGVAAGLAHAHEAGIVHRDLKPENILLTRDGLVKVADFGLARHDRKLGTFQTSHGLILGTPGYLAPELFEGATASTASDLYALGCVLFEMLAGRKAFGSENIARVLKAHVMGEHLLLSSLRPDVPAALETLVHSCLELRPDLRPVSAAELAERLEGLASQDAVQELGTAIAPVAASSSPAPRRRHRPQLAPTVVSQAPRRRPSAWRRPMAAVAAAAAVAGIAFLWQLRRPETATAPATSPVPVRAQPAAQFSAPPAAGAGVPGAVLLDSEKGRHAVGFAALASGGELVVAWSRRSGASSVVVARRSLDAGATWSPPEAIGEASDRLEEPRLARSRGGWWLVAISRSQSSREYRVHTFFRAPTDSAWTARSALRATGWPAALVCSAGDSAIHVLHDDASKTPRLQWVTMAEDAGVAPAVTPVPALPGAGSVQAAWTDGARRLVLARALDASTHSAIWHCWAAAGGSWSKWRQVTGPEEDLGKADALDLATVAGELVLAYTSGNHLRVRTARSPEGPFTEPVQLENTEPHARSSETADLRVFRTEEENRGQLCFYPSLATQGGRAVLGYHRALIELADQAVQDPRLIVRTGAGWERTHDLPLSGRLFLDQRLVACGGKLVWIGNCIDTGIVAATLEGR